MLRLSQLCFKPRNNSLLHIIYNLLPVLSIQIGLTRDNPFVLDRKGIVRSILDRQELKKVLGGWLSGTKIASTSAFKVPTGAADRIIKWMEAWL